MDRPEDRVKQLLSRYPQPVLLEPRRSVPAALVVAGLVWTISFLAATFIGLGNISPGTNATGLFAVGALSAAGGLLPIVLGVRDLRRPNKLMLTPTGFELSGARAETAYKWADVEKFRSHWNEDGNGSVLFDDVAPTRPRRRGADHDHELTTKYGLPPELLAELMRRWRRRAVADTPK